MVQRYGKDGQITEVSNILAVTIPEVLSMSFILFQFQGLLWLLWQAGQKKVKVTGEHRLEIRPVIPAESSQRMKLFTSMEFICLTICGQSAGFMGESHRADGAAFCASVPLFTLVLRPPCPSPWDQPESTESSSDSRHLPHESFPDVCSPN